MRKESYDHETWRITYRDYACVSMSVRLCRVVLSSGCRREQLYDEVCDEECESEVCHWDNWRCFATDEFKLYDKAGHGWDDDLEECYASGCDESLLFNSVCDDLCNTEVCHFDNFMCGEEMEMVGYSGHQEL